MSDTVSSGDEGERREDTPTEHPGSQQDTSSLKTESQNRREERLAERAVKGTDFRAETPRDVRREERRKDTVRGALTDSVLKRKQRRCLVT